MPELFKWQPANLIDWSDETLWRTMRTEMESGRIRTRQKWARPRRNATHLLIPFLELNEVDEIYDFFNARKGGHETFYLPSWCRETRLSTAVSSGNTVLYLESVRCFTASPNLHGYYIHLTHATSILGQQVCCIRSIVSSYSVVVTPAITGNYPAKSWVQRAYLVRFAGDSFKRNRKGMHIYEVELTFEEAT